jgi:hypothetical protein
MNVILQRLETAMNLHFEGSRANLARAIGKRPDALNQYFSKGSIPGGEILAALWQVGISADWLLTGEGEMYAKNEAGTKLKKAKQGIGKEHEPELVGNLSDMPEFNQRVIDIEDLETLESLITKIKGQTNAKPNPKGT